MKRKLKQMTKTEITLLYGSLLTEFDSVMTFNAHDKIHVNTNKYPPKNVG